MGPPGANGVTRVPLLSEDGRSARRTASTSDRLWCEMSRTWLCCSRHPDQGSGDHGARWSFETPSQTFCSADAKTVTIDGATVVDRSQRRAWMRSRLSFRCLARLLAPAWLVPAAHRAAQQSGSGAERQARANGIRCRYGRQPRR